MNELEEITFYQIRNIEIQDVLNYLESISNTSHQNLNQFRSALSKLYKYSFEYSKSKKIEISEFNPFESESVKDRIKQSKIKSVKGITDARLNILDTNIPKLFVEEIMQDVSSQSRERDILIIKTFFHTGIRVERLINLTLNDFFIRDGLYFLHVTKAKGNKNRVLNVSSKFYAELLTYTLNHGLSKNDNIFRARGNQPIKSPKSINNMIHKYEDRLKEQGLIAEETIITAHKFREMATTKRIEDGWDILDVADFLGHATSTTSRGYVNVNKMFKDNRNSESYDRQF